MNKNFILDFWLDPLIPILRMNLKLVTVSFLSLDETFQHFLKFKEETLIFHKLFKKYFHFSK